MSLATFIGVFVVGFICSSAQTTLMSVWQSGSTSTTVNSVSGACAAFDELSGIGVAFTVDTSFSFVNLSLRGFNISNGEELWVEPTNCTNSKSSFLLVVENACGRSSFVLGCDDALYFVSRTGRTSFTSIFPPEHRLVVMSQGSDGPQRSFLYVPKTKMLILSVATSSNEFGTLLFDVASCSFTSEQLLGSCGQEPLKALFAADNDPGFFQVCVQQSVMFLPFPTSTIRPWKYLERNLTNPISVGCVSSTTVLVVAWQSEEVVFVVGFYMSSSTPTWSLSVASTQGPVLMLCKNDVVVLPLPQAMIYGIEFQHGILLWQTDLGDYPRALLSDTEFFPDLFFIAAYQDLLTFNATDGSQIAMVPFNCAPTGFVYGVGLPLQWLVGSFNKSGTTPGLSLRALALVGGLCIQLYDPTLQVMIGVVSVDEEPIQPPQVVVEVGLAIVKSGCISMMSLHPGWEVKASGALQEGSVGFVITPDGSFGAIDRNGRFLWKTYASQQVEGVPVALGLLLTVSKAYAINAYNAFNGSLLATLLVPSDCNATLDNVVPSITSGLVANMEGTSAYFAAGLACILRVDADLSIHSIPTPWVVSTAPVLDEDNQLVILMFGKQVFSVSTDGAQTHLIAVIESVVDIVPSSHFSPTQDWGKGLNPLLFVVSASSIYAFDMKAATDQPVWFLTQGTIYEHSWFNNSLYTISIAGICKTLIGVMVPTSERIAWCHGAYAVESAETISNLAFSTDGVLFFALDSNLYAIDAYSAVARWSPSGFVALPYSNCAQLSFSKELFSVLAQCDRNLVAIDAAELPHSSLLLVKAPEAIQFTFYDEPTLLVGAPGEQGSMLGFQLPSRITNRCPFPLSAPTSAPIPITIPPGFVPPATPIPNISATYPTAVQTMSLLATAVGPGAFGAVMVASCAAPQELLPGVVVVGPVVCNNEISKLPWCCVEAYNVSIPGGVSLLWATEVASAANNGCVAKNAVEVVGINSCFVVFRFGNLVAGLDAQGGRLLWNSSDLVNSTESIITFSVVELPGLAYETIVVVVTDMRVVALDIATGMPLFTAEIIATHPSCFETTCAVLSLQVRVPPGLNSIAVVIASKVGLQVITASLEELSASTKLWMNSSDPRALCAKDSILLAAPSNEDRPSHVWDSSFFYVVCIDANQNNLAVLLRVNVSDGQQESIQNITLMSGEGTPVAFMAEQASNLQAVLVIVTNSFTRIINVSAETVTVLTTSTVYEPARIGTAGSVLLLVGGSAIVGVNKFSGAVLWNLDTGNFVIPPTLNTPALTARTMGPETTFVSLGMPFVLNTTSGQIIWAGQSNNFYTSAVTKWAPSGLVAGGSPLDTFLITFSLATTNSFFAWSTMPLPAIAGTQISCFVGAFSLFEEATVPRQVGVVASTYSQGPVVTNFDWVKMAIEPALNIVTVFSHVLGTQVAVLLGLTTTALYREDTGELLKQWFVVDVCPSSPQNANNYFVAIAQVAGAVNILFSDGTCLYQLNVGTVQLTAILLLVNDPVDSLCVSSDNQTAVLASVSGLVIAVDVSTLTVLWTSDALDLDSTSTKVWMLPYDATVVRESQQLIVAAGRTVFSLFMSTGSIAWMYQASIYQAGNTIDACLTNDGGAALISGSTVIKLSLDVGENVQRLSWMHDLGFGWTLTAIAAPKNANCLVVSSIANNPFQQQNVMFDTTNGAVIWNVSYDNVEFSKIKFVDDSSAPGEPPAVFIGDDPLSTIYVFEVSTGQLLYWVPQGLQSGTQEIEGIVVLGSGQDIYEPLCLSMIARPTSPLLPSAAPAPPPIIPTGYHFVMPLPSSGVAPQPAAGVPYPLLSWQYLPDTQSNGYPDYGFWITMDGARVLLMVSYNVSDNGAESARVVAVNSVTGDEVLSLAMWSSTCRPRWMAKLNSRFVVLACHDDVDRLTVIDGSTSHLTPVAMISLPGDFYEFAPSVMELNNITSCIYSATGQSPSLLLCVNLSISVPRTPSSTVDTAELVNLTAMLYQCPQQAPLVNTPKYSKASGTLLVPCSYGIEGTYGLASVNPSTGESVWNVMWDYYYNSGIGPMFLDPQEEHCAVIVPNQYYNWSLQLIRVRDGAVEVNITLPSLGSTTAQFLLMKEIVNDTAASGNEYLFVFAVLDILTAYSSATEEPLWKIDEHTPYTGYSQIALLYDDVVENRTLILIAGTEHFDTLFAVELLSGVRVFKITSHAAGSYDNALDLVIMHNGSSALSIYGNYQYYYDLGARELLMINPGNLLPGGYLDLSTAGGPQLFDLADQTGAVSQFVIQGPRAVPRLVDHYTTVTAGDGQTFVVASSGMSTYMINASGFEVWGTTVQDAVNDLVFDPALFTVAGKTILVKSVRKRSFYGFNAHNGSLLYAGSLPLCQHGQGAPRHGVLGSAADHDTNAMYVTIGNRCLYRIDAATGEVMAFDSSASLVSNILISPHCVVTVSSYGGITCRDRVSLDITWKVSYGYVQSAPGDAVQVRGGSPEFVLVALGARLICIMEQTGEVLWEIPVGPFAAFVAYNSQIYLVSCDGAASISLDPNIAFQDRVRWFIPTASLFGFAPTCDSQLLPPTVTADGSILVAFDQYIASLEPATGTCIFRIAASGPCAWVYAPPVLADGAPTNNVFFTSCGHTDVRSVANGTTIAVLGGGASGGQSCSGATIHVLAETGWVVFCDVNNGMNMEELPSFVAQRAPTVPVVPPSPPVAYSLPPGFTPQGIHTPAPTYPWIPADALPDLSCTLNMAAMYHFLSTCLSESIDSANNASVASGGFVNCSATANAIGKCTSAWLSGSNCFGAVMYLNTVLDALNRSQKMAFCGNSAPLRCLDGNPGAVTLCGAINVAALACDGQTFPASLLSHLPRPINQLPTFKPSVSPSSSASPAGNGLSTAAIGGIACGALAMTVLAAMMAKRASSRRRKNSERLIPSPPLDDSVPFSSRTGSELGSVFDKKSSRRLLSEEDGLADYSSVN